MVSRRLYEVIALACGFVLIDYGFGTIAIGMQGARELTSQFVGANLIIAGSAAVFWGLYYLLRPITPHAAPETKEIGGMPDIGSEVVVAQKTRTGPKYAFYKNVEYLGYFFTFLGLVSAADLVLQVFIPRIYNEIRFWTETLLVIFGVLSYAIFGSIGRLGAQEEQVIVPAIQPTPQAATIPQAVPAKTSESAAPSVTEILQVRLNEFVKSEAGQYERNLTETVYDLMRIEPWGLTIWREDRIGIRSVYLAGPYELTWKLIEEHANSGEQLRIGSLYLPLETLRVLLDLRVSAASSAFSAAAR